MEYFSSNKESTKPNYEFGDNVNKVKGLDINDRGKDNEFEFKFDNEG